LLILGLYFKLVDTNKPKPIGPEQTNEKDDSPEPSPTQRNTLGDVLDRLRPKKTSSSFTGKTQNQLIEEFNRRRNQGLDAPQNPDFRPDGSPVLERNRQNRIISPTTTQHSSTHH